VSLRPGDRLRRIAVAAFYGLTTRLMALVLWIFGRWEVTGTERIPPSGPLLVVANHLNLADPPLLGASLPRPIRFMAKQELFDSAFAGACMRLFGAFPVRREGADLKALHTARALLAQGEVVGMFPEGHRSGGAGLLPAHPGTAFLALQARVPVLPVAITGSETVRSPRVLLHHPRITVTVGEPFCLEPPARIDAASVRAATDEIMRHIACLLPPSYRGAYTDEGDS